MREGRGFLVDLHCHSWPRSKCSSLAAHDVVRLSRERGLDGVCFTEHDGRWPEEALEALHRETRFALYAGVELTTDAGHLLVFGLPGDEPLPITASAAADAAARSGALVYLAHPARDGLLRLTPEMHGWFSGVETANGSDSAVRDSGARGLAAAFALPGIGGSDAHTAAEAGSAATRLPRLPRDTADLLALLRAGDYEAVRLS